MSSEKTACRHRHRWRTAFDPFAMLPFCGYNTADYFAHEIGQQLAWLEGELSATD